MMKKPAITIIALATLTVAGFVIVSSLFGGRQAPPASSNRSGTQLETRPSPQAAASPPTQSGKADAQLRADLNQAQTLLDQINLTVLAGDWRGAQQFFAEFEQRTRLLPAPRLNHPDISPVMQDFFTLYRVQLARALAAQNLQQSRAAANQLFGIVGEQRVRLGTRGVPIEFQRLGFLIREIEIWNEADDAEMVRARATSLREAWKEVRPVIAARRNGLEQAGIFDQLIEKLAVAERRQDLATLASEFSKEFDVMSGLFQRVQRQASAATSSVKPTEDDD